MVSNCNSFHLVVTGDQCGNLAATYGISLANFYLWNPAVGSTCASLDVGDYVCVGVIGGTATTTAGNGVATPTPTQAGMVTNCAYFHLVASGDQCGNIAATYDISLADFYQWNPAVGSTCAALDIGYYVCVNVIQWASLGCYSDTSASRALDVVGNVTGGGGALTIESCQAACLAAGYTLAGVEWAQQCCKSPLPPLHPM